MEAPRGLVAAVVVAALLVPGCRGDYARLEATVVAQGQAIEQLARTPAPTLTPRPTLVATPTATAAPSPTATPPPPTPTASPAPTATRTASRLLEDAGPSIVRVMAGDSEGTGFVARQPGRVLTAGHVVVDSPDDVVVLTREGVQYSAAVLGLDDRRDLALLSVPGLSVAPLPLTTEALPGDAVFVVGYSAGLPGEPTITRGIVSARRLDPDTGVALLQTDATLNPGASGGPLLSERGEVVGLNVARVRGRSRQYESLGFAVSAQEIGRFYEEVDSGKLKPSARSTPTPPAARR